ncbi:hypothetical protein O9992_12905 [Vibrio lentus]|nr:hypothetical protein [Vibrio lentus]
MRERGGGKCARPLDIEFETSHLNALLLTHTHIDHDPADYLGYLALTNQFIALRRRLLNSLL